MSSIADSERMRSFDTRARGFLAVSAVVVALLAWLWPIGMGGKMPVGGDVTQFFIGLMGFLGDSLRAAGCRSGTTCGVMVFPAWRRARWGSSILLIWFSIVGLTPRRHTSSAWCSIRSGEGWEHSGRRVG